MSKESEKKKEPIAPEARPVPKPDFAFLDAVSLGGVPGVVIGQAIQDLPGGRTMAYHFQAKGEEFNPQNGGLVLGDRFTKL